MKISRNPPTAPRKNPAKAFTPPTQPEFLQFQSNTTLKIGDPVMKINTITLSRLRNDANFQFHTEFKELAEKQTPEALKIKPLYDAYLPLYDKVDLTLKKINKSSITEQIQNADKASILYITKVTRQRSLHVKIYPSGFRESAGYHRPG
jgi:hypothetical protein